MKKIVVLIISIIAVSTLFMMGVSASEYAEGKALEGQSIQDGYIKDYFEQSVFYSTPTTVDKEALAEVFLEGWQNLDEQIDISEFNIPLAQVDSVFDIYTETLNNNPQLFHVKGRVTPLYNTSTELLVYFKPHYSFDATEYPTHKEAFDNAVNKALASVDETMTTDIEKALAIHDYIVTTAEYDLETFQTLNSQHPTSFSAYGVLVSKIGVCQSYTLAYKYLLGRLGIECTTVETKELGHIWNVAKLDGEWYHIDLTYDDPISSPNNGKTGVSIYTYFAASDAEFKSVEGKHLASDWVRGNPNAIAESEAYANAFWKDAYANMSRFDGYYYYTTFLPKNDESNTLNTSVIYLVRSSLDELTSVETLREFTNLRWYIDDEDSPVKDGAFRLIPFTYDGDLYYNTTTEIYRYCENYPSDELVYTPEIQKGFIVPLDTTSDGKINLLRCSKTSRTDPYIVYTSIPAAPLDGGHNYQENIIAPGDLTQGYTEHTCTTCGDTYNDTYTNPLLYKPGDINGDKIISALDNIAFSRYIAKWDGYSSIVEFNCDLNNDGVLSSTDTVILARYLANYPGYNILPLPIE